jgi:phytoene dehydrogenase-like protein
MGRTRRTLRDQFDALEREWTPFRRSLRRAHQPAFDRLFDRARSHADAAGQQNAPDRWRAFAFCVLLAQERALAEREEAIARHRDEIETLRERVEALEAAGPEAPVAEIPSER